MPDFARLMRQGCIATEESKGLVRRKRCVKASLKKKPTTSGHPQSRLLPSTEAMVFSAVVDIGIVLVWTGRMSAGTASSPTQPGSRADDQQQGDSGREQQFPAVCLLGMVGPAGDRRLPGAVERNHAHDQFTESLAAPRVAPCRRFMYNERVGTGCQHMPSPGLYVDRTWQIGARSLPR